MKKFWNTGKSILLNLLKHLFNFQSPNKSYVLYIACSKPFYVLLLYLQLYIIYILQGSKYNYTAYKHHQNCTQAFVIPTLPKTLLHMHKCFRNRTSRAPVDVWKNLFLAASRYVLIWGLLLLLWPFFHRFPFPFCCLLTTFCWSFLEPIARFKIITRKTMSTLSHVFIELHFTGNLQLPHSEPDPLQVFLVF